MDTNTLQVLGYDEIRAMLEERTRSYLGKEHVQNMEPLTDKLRIQSLLDETAEAKALLDSGTSVPIPSMDGMERIAKGLGKGMMWNEVDLTHVETFIRGCRQLRQYLEKKAEVAPGWAAYASALHGLDSLEEEIHRCIEFGEIRDTASGELHRIRKSIATLEDRIKRKVETLLSKYKAHLQEAIVTQRGNHYVLPIRRESKRLVPGSVLDVSGSGQTVYIEPTELQALHRDLESERALEEHEKARVLAYLSGLVDDSQQEIAANLTAVGYCDFTFAKAKLARSMDASKVKVVDGPRRSGANNGQTDSGRGGSGITTTNSGRRRNPEHRTEALEPCIDLRQARHPLLGPDCVPIDVRLGACTYANRAGYRAIVITGPNTGGKTVSLKTVGLITLMAQSGLLVPAHPDSTLSVFTNVLADIGDGQSIEQSLSTFSAHITNVARILKAADARSLVLLDEMATGTDPTEGVALSIAILEQLYQQGAAILATTHFLEIKEYAEETPGFENASMDFDVETLRPLYHLRIGQAGQSHAFLIAERLGLDEAVIARAKEVTRGERRGHTLSADRDGTPVNNATDHEALVRVAASESEDCETRVEAGAGAATEAGAGIEVHATAEATPREPEVEGESEAEAWRPRPGDRVWIHPLKQSGVVYSAPDARGNTVVIVKKQRMTFNQKRLAPYLTREQLYPKDYDLDIVLESKEVRKKRHTMSRKHVDGLSIEHPQPGERREPR